MAQAAVPDVNFSDVGGHDRILQSLKKIGIILEHPEVRQLVKLFTKSLLIHGPKGCGTTLLPSALAGEYKVPLLSISSAKLLVEESGESEVKLKDLFYQAAELAPCVLFFDDIEAITADCKLVGQLANCMHDLESKRLPLLVIGATNSYTSLDPVLKSRKCFDMEFQLKYPNRDNRNSILKIFCEDINMADDVSLLEIADITPGYTGSDLRVLISIVMMYALDHPSTKPDISETQREMYLTKLKRFAGITKPKVMFSLEELGQLKLTKSDFQNVMLVMKPIAKEGMDVFKTVWTDIAGLDYIKEKVKFYFLDLIRTPEAFQTGNATRPARVLLAGPPGCGKTLIAKAIASENILNCLQVRGAELLAEHVEDSVHIVADLFKRAATLAPCVIFFDNIDALCPKRSSSGEGSCNPFINAMCLELDHAEKVHVLAATSRLDDLDEALLYSHRLRTVLYVGLPTADERVEILKVCMKDGTMPEFAADVSLDSIGKDRRCHGFSGADMLSLLNEALILSAMENEHSVGASPFKTAVITKEHVEAAFSHVIPAVGLEIIESCQFINTVMQYKNQEFRRLIDTDIAALLSRLEHKQGYFSAD